MEEDKSLDIEVFWILSHTNQYLHFETHHPLEHKLPVIRNVHHQTENIPAKTGGVMRKKKGSASTSRSHIKTRNPNTAFVKSAKKSGKNTTAVIGGEQKKHKNVAITYVAGVSENIVSKHGIQHAL